MRIFPPTLNWNRLTRRSTIGMTMISRASPRKCSMSNRMTMSIRMIKQCVGAEVSLPPIDAKMMNTKVRGWKRLADGSVIGCVNSNPILDTRTHKVNFPDGQQIAKMTVNNIAQNMYAMCDEEGNQFLLLAGIIGHQKDESALLSRADMNVRKGSNTHIRKSTRGW